MKVCDVKYYDGTNIRNSFSFSDEEHRGRVSERARFTLASARVRRITRGSKADDPIAKSNSNEREAGGSSPPNRRPNAKHGGSFSKSFMGRIFKVHGNGGSSDGAGVRGYRVG